MTLSTNHLRLNRTRSYRAGLTLIEVLVALLILGIIAAGISKVMAGSWQSKQTVDLQNEAQNRAQLAIDEIVDGILSDLSGTHPGDPSDYGMRGCAGIESGDRHSVTVLFNNSNGAKTHSVTFRLSTASEVINGETLTGRELIRERQDVGSSAVKEVLYHDVENLEFTYGRVEFPEPSYAPVVQEYQTIAGIESTIKSFRASITIDIIWNPGAAQEEHYRATETSWVKFRNKF